MLARLTRLCTRCQQWGGDGTAENPRVAPPGRVVQPRVDTGPKVVRQELSRTGTAEALQGLIPATALLVRIDVMQRHSRTIPLTQTSAIRRRAWLRHVSGVLGGTNSPPRSSRLTE